MVPDKPVALDAARFLDSPQAAALGLPRAELKRAVELFLAACYDELGTKPHLLDGQDVHVVLGHLLPARLKRKDPLAEHVPAILAAYFEHLETEQVVSQPFEIRRALEGTREEFLEAVRTGREVHHAPREKQAPVVHQVEKLGRNDPCFCGSGKKFKKCHGQGG
jgi:hypothetical protein